MALNSFQQSTWHSAIPCKDISEQDRGDRPTLYTSRRLPLRDAPAVYFTLCIVLGPFRGASSQVGEELVFTLLNWLRLALWQLCLLLVSAFLVEHGLKPVTTTSPALEGDDSGSFKPYSVSADTMESGQMAFIVLEPNYMTLRPRRSNENESPSQLGPGLSYISGDNQYADGTGIIRRPVSACLR